MRPDQLDRLLTVSPPTLSPDGRWAVVSSSRPDLEKDTYRRRLELVDVTGSEAVRPLTQGPRDAAPVWSPDGRWIAFLRAEEKGRPQLHVLPAEGGAPVRLTDLPGGAGTAVWSPDSRRIAFAARVPEPHRYGLDEDVPPAKEAPRRITGLQYRLDGIGFLLDQRSHVFVVDVPRLGEAAPARQLTDGDHDDENPAWTPDGRSIVFTSARHDDRESTLINDVFRIGAEGGAAAPERLTDTSLTFGHLGYAADGTLVLVGWDPGPSGRSMVFVNAGLFTLAAGATGRPRRLTDAATVGLSDCAPVLQEGAALVAVENRGAVDLVRVPLDGSPATTLHAGHEQVTGIAGTGDTVVVTVADPASPAEVAVLTDGALVRRTHFFDGVEVLQQQELTGEAGDGYPVHGWLVTPPGEGPHPVLLMIHGGPYAQYGWCFFDEAQVYADAGFAVVYGNPRGSSGYGVAHGEHIRHDVGERSAEDLLALLDTALQRPELDASRVGVLGGSHGGFMTTWLVGHTDRFRAAVSERAVNAIDSFTGSSDIGWGFSDDLYGTDQGRLTAQSPFAAADAISTPLLIIHSEEDWRCPVEQAQRLYVALRTRGATVELLLFPGEGHELSRSGTPRHRMARFDAIVDWFNRHV